MVLAGEAKRVCRLLRNYENRDVLMVITVKPRRRVDTPEAGFCSTGETGRKRRAEGENAEGDSRNALAQHAAGVPAHLAPAVRGQAKVRQGHVTGRREFPSERVRFISRPRLRHRAQQCVSICPLRGRNIVNPAGDDKLARAGARPLAPVRHEAPFRNASEND